MNFAEIASAASPEIARKLQDDIFFNAHIAGRGQEVDAQRLDDLTRGAIVLGIETVDYPLTDGLNIYMRQPTGDVIALFIETDADEQDGGSYEVLRISKAVIT